jgi:polyhydroxyalkanoate synthase
LPNAAAISSICCRQAPARRCSGHRSSGRGGYRSRIHPATLDPTQIIKDQSQLSTDLTRLWQRTASQILSKTASDPVISPAKQDKRFKNEAWSQNAVFDYMKQSYLLMSRYVESSVRGIKGLDPHTHRKAQFYTRQMVSALSPTNFAMTNPAVLDVTVESRGENLINGLRNLVGDLERGGGRLTPKMTDLAAFTFGENIANSTGKVVFQNELMQLIQYAPSTPTVHRRPLLIVPPWINKFYILDLKPQNSFIKWCVEQGHTVFVISWSTPARTRRQGSPTTYSMARGGHQRDRARDRRTEINAIGYCIGGTLLAARSPTWPRSMTSALWPRRFSRHCSTSRTSATFLSSSTNTSSK